MDGFITEPLPANFLEAAERLRVLAYEAEELAIEGITVTYKVNI